MIYGRNKFCSMVGWFRYFFCGWLYLHALLVSAWSTNGGSDYQHGLQEWTGFASQSSGLVPVYSSYGLPAGYSDGQPLTNIIWASSDDGTSGYYTNGYPTIAPAQHLEQDTGYEGGASLLPPYGCDTNYLFSVVPTSPFQSISESTNTARENIQVAILLASVEDSPANFTATNIYGAAHPAVYFLARYYWVWPSQTNGLIPFWTNTLYYCYIDADNGPEIVSVGSPVSWADNGVYQGQNIGEFFWGTNGSSYENISGGFQNGLSPAFSLTFSVQYLNQWNYVLMNDLQVMVSYSQCPSPPHVDLTNGFPLSTANETIMSTNYFHITEGDYFVASSNLTVNGNFVSVRNLAEPFWPIGTPP